MATVRILLVIVCIAAIGSSRGADRSIVKIRKHELTVSPAVHQLLAIARKEIGVTEVKVPNGGPRVSMYLSYTGVKTPAPWCAAWVSFVFGQAGYQQPRTAWSPALFPASRLVSEARPGAVMGLYFPSLKRIGHCGIIEKIKGSWVYSIEGNSNLTGGREGDRVCRRMRHQRTISCYADWSGKGGIR